MRLLKFLIVSLVIGFTAVFIASKWNTWFHNPEEEPYTVDDNPQWVLLTFGNGEQNSRYVSWIAGYEIKKSFVELINSDKDDTSKVNADGEVFKSRNGQGAYYMARLNDLNPASHYKYRVCTGNKHSQWFEFETPIFDNDKFSFLYVGDVQDTINGRTNVFLKEAYRRNPDSEFLICGGDLVERPTHKYWNEAFHGLDSLCQTHPFLNVTGNHDYIKGVIGKLERRFQLVFSYFLDSNIADNMVYSMKYGNAQFFILDSNREIFYLFLQREWLREQLEKSQAKWKIVVLHHPLYSIRGNNLIQKSMFNEIIQEYGVDLVLQGHEHAYARLTIKNNEGKPTTPVYTISHCSPKNYLIEFDDSFDKYGISSRYYQYIKVKGDTMAVSAYNVSDNSLYDSLCVVKNNDVVNIIDCGKRIKEYLEYTPDPDSKKSLRFAERIEEYKKKHPERYL